MSQMIFFFKLLLFKSRVNILLFFLSQKPKMTFFFTTFSTKWESLTSLFFFDVDFFPPWVRVSDSADVLKGV